MKSGSLSFLILLPLFLLSCTNPATKRPVPPMVHISEIAPDRQTALTNQNFIHLIQIYDLAPFFYTYRIQIERGVPARSHPVLTLNTEYAENPSALLAQWLHEEFHWLANSHPDKIRLAIRDLRKMFPKVPVTKSEPAKLIYLHFIVYSLEYQAMTKFLGKHDAIKVARLKLEKENHYHWVYETVILQSERIQAVIVKNGLLPKALL
jgi:hypothetical protein